MSLFLVSADDADSELVARPMAGDMIGLGSAAS
ncbi:hypothetical protein SAJA_13180 [Salinisphaera japonica YTM-1]|uniref:Uncharacterized protein n=1 Tax=Salinisphaera japonica YTM-1 TaxID=1209778 RepID=A0A423PIG2_9GAMM|nr:hypothetical protein SAJA_13180 [Salinisphaera japonica YTM-1]